MDKIYSFQEYQKEQGALTFEEMDRLHEETFWEMKRKIENGSTRLLSGICVSVLPLFWLFKKHCNPTQKMVK